MMIRIRYNNIKYHKETLNRLRNRGNNKTNPSYQY